MTRVRAPIRRVVVVVPVHDEERELPGALDALAAASAEAGVPVDVTVVLDACSDGSHAVPGPGVRVVTVDLRTVGGARRAGFAGQPTDGDVWFATTDADSRVPLDWLRRQVDLANAGADVVAGTVVARDWEGWRSDAGQVFDAEYRVQRHPGGHGHVHGANLGVRASAYAAIGGFPQVAHDEDVHVVDALLAAGHTVCWGTETPVATSTRRHGRAPAGFADALVDLMDPPEDARPAAPGVTPQIAGSS
ncbi:glycosyltransferase [Williamsia deligens]|uniref:4,4'-diaponeurosporenoate glycosyltransferase n=2 Tax=Williamsia deligens TaxID=321325 RepID=A0ABW3G968_9NOCA|nr:Glycosyl transferase family 2 [Williamsia deligens]